MGQAEDDARCLHLADDSMDVSVDFAPPSNVMFGATTAATCRAKTDQIEQSAVKSKLEPRCPPNRLAPIVVANIYIRNPADEVSEQQRNDRNQRKSCANKCKKCQHVAEPREFWAAGPGY